MPRASRQKLLERYREKRDFSKTAEPSGAPRRGAKPARAAKRAALAFVVQKHAARRLHYDFRLELDGVLKSWAVTRGPSLDPADKRLAVEVEDHPLDYGGFEGTIPNGQYGGGAVMLWDRGTWAPVGDAQAGIAAGHLKFDLYGERLKGRWALVRMKPRGKEARAKNPRNNWLLIKERDEEARAGTPIVETASTSVASGRDIAEIGEDKDAVWQSNRPAAENAERLALLPARAKSASSAKPPSFIAPQLATLVDAAPQGKAWLHEIKYDGYRAIASIGGGKAIIRTRNGLDWTARFGTLPRALSALPVKSAVLDGEITVTDKSGHTDFAALQAALAEHDGAGITYNVFDLLELDGKDLRQEPLLSRKKTLEKLLSGRHDAQIRYSDHVVGGGPEVFRKACALKLEGIVSKRADAPYRSARTKSWLKVKCASGQEFVILGWQESEVRGRAFSSLLLAVHEEGALRYAGRVGTGFDEKRRGRMERLLKAREIKEPAAEIPRAARRHAHFVTPDLVAEIAFRGWSQGKLVRQASFKGLRADKPAATVTEERRQSVRIIKSGKMEKGTEEIEGVRITHPDETICPGETMTKRDLARHLLTFAEPMLRHIARRPLSLVRFPDASAEKGFFQKHASPGFPKEIKTIPLREKEGQADYLYIEDVAGLIAAAQMRAVELHIWGSHIDTVEKPDRLVFDLDPDIGLDFAAVKNAAKDMRARLKALGLQSFLLATGGKGLHVVVPIVPRHEWPKVKDFTHSLANLMAEESPELYTTALSKARRHGRIFIDYLRNERGATAIAPFSPRVREGMPVAWPLAWSALAKLESAHPVSVADAKSKWRKDPWQGYHELRQELPLAAKR